MENWFHCLKAVPETCTYAFENKFENRIPSHCEPMIITFDLCILQNDILFCVYTHLHNIILSRRTKIKIQNSNSSGPHLPRTFCCIGSLEYDRWWFIDDKLKIVDTPLYNNKTSVRSSSSPFCTFPPAADDVRPEFSFRIFFLLDLRNNVLFICYASKTVLIYVELHLEFRRPFLYDTYQLTRVNNCDRKLDDYGFHFLILIETMT